MTPELQLGKKPATPGMPGRCKIGGYSMTEIIDDPILDARAAARFCNLSISTLAKLRCIGGSAPYIKAGSKILYRRSDLTAWLNARRVSNTTQAALIVPPRLTDEPGAASSPRTEHRGNIDIAGSNSGWSYQAPNTPQAGARSADWYRRFGWR